MLRPPSLNTMKSLLPSQVEVALSATAPTGEHQPPAAETVAMATMRPDRRNEFRNGRTCARTALAALGFPDCAIPVGANREPLWPDGIVGSISHCGPVAAAAAARSDEISALGIDLEHAEPLDAGLLNMICLPAERSWLQTTENPLLYAKLIFSAKESIFKCIWPTIRRFVDFQEIGIHITVDTGTFAPVSWADSLPDPVIRGIAGRYRLRNGWVMTTACIAHQATAPGQNSRQT